MRKRSWKQLYATIGTIIVDLGKLVFGSLILGSILLGSLNHFQTLIVGTASAVALFAIGVVSILKGKE